MEPAYPAPSRGTPGTTHNSCEDHMIRPVQMGRTGGLRACMYAHRSPTSRAGTTESAVAVVGLEEERICHDARWVISVGGAGAGLGMVEGSQQPDRRAVKSRRSRCRGVKALVMYLALCYLWAFTGLLSPCAEDAKTVEEEEEKKNIIAYGWLRDSHVSRLRSRPTRMCFPDTRSFNQGATSPSLGYAMLVR